MQVMQACVFDAPGNPEAVLETRVVPVPSARHGELLVRMEASPVQPADRMFINGRYRVKPAHPQVAGLEGCGKVVRDESHLGLLPGVRVAFRHPGCWAEYNVVPAEKVFRVPEGVSTEAACQFSLNPVTAWALLHEARAKTGDWILLNAASSTVAGLLRALARSEGLRTVDILRSRPPEARAPAVGSDEPDLAAALLEATGGQPAVALLDAIGGNSVTRVMPALANGATILSYGVLGGGDAQVGNPDLIYRNLTWKGFGIDQWLADNAGLAHVMAQVLWRHIAENALPLPVRSSHVLSRVQEALAAAAHGTGKVLIVPGPSTSTFR